MALRRICLLCVCAGLLAGCGGGSDDGESGMSGPAPVTSESPLRFEMERLNGEPEDLAKYQGKVVLVVNTASECGFTPQFEQLQSLYEDLGDEGLVILGFPADDVASQEPREDEAIARFCRANFGVTFPMFAKINVVGEEAAPLFKELGAPDWNFNKYLLGRDGLLLQQWGARTEPDDPELVGAIRAEL